MGTTSRHVPPPGTRFSTNRHEVNKTPCVCWQLWDWDSMLTGTARHASDTPRPRQCSATQRPLTRAPVSHAHALPSGTAVARLGALPRRLEHEFSRVRPQGVCSLRRSPLSRWCSAPTSPSGIAELWDAFRFSSAHKPRAWPLRRSGVNLTDGMVPGCVTPSGAGACGIASPLRWARARTIGWLGVQRACACDCACAVRHWQARRRQSTTRSPSSCRVHGSPPRSPLPRRHLPARSSRPAASLGRLWEHINADTSTTGALCV